ncbi:MAG TPA: DMT family transporter [Syntrophales bacterium]|nr:DMT family transporter [Syntrophales bacterium]HQN77537.1 DMT family transporter [Syntrophales bacterium]HQQ26493.1 DMT family transporter [Syntrophales bacterium]
MSNPHRFMPVVAILLLSSIWGYNWVVMKLALRFMGPFDFNAVRMVLGALVLMGFMLWKGISLRPGNVLLTLLLGISQGAAGTGLILWALVSGGAGKTAILVYAMPFWIMILAWVFLGEKIRGLYWLPVIASVAGLFFLLEPWSLHGSFFSKVLAVVAGVFWAVGAILIKMLQEKPDFDLVSVTTWQTAFAALPLTVAAVLIPSRPVEWTPFLMGAMAYNGIVVCAAAFLLWTYVIRKLPAGIGGMGLLATPIIGMASAWIQLGEHINRWEAVGIVLLLSALAFLTCLRARENRRVVPMIVQE